jgi:GntR family transcriptional regulator
MVPCMIDPEGPEPLYQQVAALLRARIESDDLPANRPIPSIQQLQQEYGVARGTALHAVELLKAEGLVRVVPGRGTYVVPRK